MRGIECGLWEAPERVVERAEAVANAEGLAVRRGCLMIEEEEEDEGVRRSCI